MMMVSRLFGSCPSPVPLIACNLYVSAGRAHHAPLLLQVLADAQVQCQSLRQQGDSKNKNNSDRNTLISVVHAFADGPYDRSSFHIAGEVQAVAQVASSIGVQSIDGLMKLRAESQEMLLDDTESRHPFVGLVDHVSVMPLEYVKNQEHGHAAKLIAKKLEERGVQVFYYGDAHPDRMPLAVVRREKTTFFQSGGLDPKSSMSSNTLGVATVGAPPAFVENFNVRLTSNCDLKTARSLTKFLRERDGGIPGVEALTLPYTNDRYEMAGNLLRPDVGSAEAIETKLDVWVAQKLKDTSFSEKSELVEKAYRVGTTAQQCLQVLQLENTTEYDDQVMDRFKSYLTSTD